MGLAPVLKLKASYRAVELWLHQLFVHQIMLLTEPEGKLLPRVQSRGFLFDFVLKVKPAVFAGVQKSECLNDRVHAFLHSRSWPVRVAQRHPMEHWPGCPSYLHDIKWSWLCQIAISCSLYLFLALACSLLQLGEFRLLIVVTDVVVAVFACHFNKLVMRVQS